MLMLHRFVIYLLATAARKGCCAVQCSVNMQIMAHTSVSS